MASHCFCFVCFEMLGYIGASRSQGASNDLGEKQKRNVCFSGWELV